eukprot:3479593-Amphidinium_carterae.1
MVWVLLPLRLRRASAQWSNAVGNTCDLSWSCGAQAPVLCWAELQDDRPAEWERPQPGLDGKGG